MITHKLLNNGMIIHKLFKLTWMTSSIRLTSKTPGTKPAPIPWILWGPEHLQQQIANYQQHRKRNDVEKLHYYIRFLTHQAFPLRALDSPPVPHQPATKREMKLRAYKREWHRYSIDMYIVRLNLVSSLPKFIQTYI